MPIENGALTCDLTTAVLRFTHVKARLITLWEGLHTSFWFVPTVMVLGATALSAFTLHLDRTIDRRIIDAIPFVGMAKNAVEFFTGDFFPDKPRVDKK